MGISEPNLAKEVPDSQSAFFMKKIIPLFVILAAALCSVWAVKPFPTDPVEKAKALERYKQGLAIYAKAQKLYYAKKYEEANATYEEALTLFQDGPKPDIANSLNILGNVYLNENPRTALWYYARALSIRIADHGQEHEAVASSYNKVGVACMKMEEYDRAIAYFGGALGIFKRVIKKQHSGHFGANHCHLGNAYAAKKDYKSAVSHYEQALAVFLKVFGEKHPNIARVKRDLGFALVEKGDKKEGLVLLEEAKAMYIATEGAGYVETQELIEKLKKLK
ncbi:MAG: hypothetical protein CMI31_14155 [Opitutae bacterium]|nr:hypothetical protein [Opitutae bacterium]